MKYLEPVISVRELPPACRSRRQHLPSLADQVTDAPPADESLLLSYLGQGIDCGIYNDPGLLFDVLRPGERIGDAVFREYVPDSRRRHPHIMLTDGTWVWPGALLYYVSAYHVRLPERFRSHAAASGWKIDPASMNPEELDWDAFDSIPEPVRDAQGVGPADPLSGAKEKAKTAR